MQILMSLLASFWTDKIILEQWIWQNKKKSLKSYLRHESLATNLGVRMHGLLREITRFYFSSYAKKYYSNNTERARFLYLVSSSKLKPENTQIVFFIQPAVEHQIFW